MIASLFKHVVLASTAFRGIPAVFSSGNAVLINSRMVREMLGNVSRMTLHRWQHGLNDRSRDKIIQPLAGFPAPIMINGRRYWRQNDIEKFIADRAA